MSIKTYTVKIAFEVEAINAVEAREIVLQSIKQEENIKNIVPCTRHNEQN